jgi:hypothetical protein
MTEKQDAQTQELLAQKDEEIAKLNHQIEQGIQNSLEKDN